MSALSSCSVVQGIKDIKCRVKITSGGRRSGQTYFFIKELQLRGIINPTYTYWRAYEEYKKLEAHVTSNR